MWTPAQPPLDWDHLEGKDTGMSLRWSQSSGGWTGVQAQGESSIHFCGVNGIMVLWDFISFSFKVYISKDDYKQGASWATVVEATSWGQWRRETVALPTNPNLTLVLYLI